MHRDFPAPTPIRIAATLLAAAVLACGAGSGDDQAGHADIPTVFKDLKPVDIAYDAPVPSDPGHEAGDVPGDPAVDPGIDPDGGSVDVSTGDDSGPGLDACTPKCGGKECGGDGCGGKCGTCPSNNECIASTCVCIPDCGNRECGDDGCGETCPPGCDASVPCLDFGKCARYGPCESSSSLTCAESTVSSDNGWSVNTDVMDVYSCDAAQAHGPEKAFSFKPGQSGNVTVSLEGSFTGDPPSFLNVYLVEDQGQGCSSKSCIAFGHKTLQAAVESGKSYWIVVDSVENKNGGFYLDLDCGWL